MNSVRDHRDGTSSSRRESSTGIDCETHCQPVPIRVRKQTSRLTITQATRLLDAEVHELRGNITGFYPTWACRSHGQGLNQRGDKARAIGPGRYGMGVIRSGSNSCNRAITNTTSFSCPLVLSLRFTSASSVFYSYSYWHWQFALIWVVVLVVILVVFSGQYYHYLFF